MKTINEINWLEDIEEAKRASSASGKPILMFFHYTHCSGCINTFGKTLKKMSVKDSISEKFVPVLFETTERPHETGAYGVVWTPTFIAADDTGLEVYRWEGYLPEDDYLGQLDMAIARVALKKGNYKDAERHFDEVMIKYPLSDLAPMAMYYQGVARFNNKHDISELTRTYENLKMEFPNSIWSLKASVWSSENLQEAEKAA